MPEEVNPKGQESTEATQEAEATSTEATSGESGTGSSEEEVSPLWEGISEDHPVRKEVKKLREEAAAKRTNAQQIAQENETLKTQLKEAKTPEEVQSLISEHEKTVNSLRSQMLREKIANTFKLPEDLAELLKGDDEDALKAHAEKLSQYVPKSQTSPSGTPPRGGKNPTAETMDIDDIVKLVESNRR